MKQELCRINDRIRAREVRVIDDAGRQLGVIPTFKAVSMALEKGLDLVEVQANANPPVCKILDYGKYKYELKKKSKDSKRKQQIMKQKEVQLSYNISQHDVEVKLKHAREFLLDNCKVFFTMRLRGRERAHQDFARHIFEKIKETLGDVGKIDSDVKPEGNTLNMLLAPMPGSGKKPQAENSTPANRQEQKGVSDAKTEISQGNEEKV